MTTRQHTALIVALYCNLFSLFCSFLIITKITLNNMCFFIFVHRMKVNVCLVQKNKVYLLYLIYLLHFTQR